MTRIIESSHTGPVAIPKDSVPGANIHVCRCGLSQKPPLCDGTHRITRNEPTGRVVRYERVGDELVAQDVDVTPVPPRVETSW